jgi:uncharacterized repeat protein (TIGR03803 family)
MKSHALRGTPAAKFSVMGSMRCLLAAGLTASAGSAWSQGGAIDGRHAGATPSVAVDSTPRDSGVRVHYLADFDREPTTGLTRGADGNFYGATGGGGPGDTLFRLTPGNELTVLYTFTGDVGAVTYPLAQASDGSLWGTSEAGGAHSCGVVFRVTLDGVFTDMHDFDCFAGGDLPMSGLVADATGAFFGTTYGGGVHHDGIAYRITLDGEFQVVAEFSRQAGKFPRGNLLRGRDDCMYGTTPAGGKAKFGTLYRLCQANAGYDLTVLHDFIKSEANGGVLGGLVYDAAQQWMVATATTTIFAFNPDTSAIRVAKLGTLGTSPLVLGPDGATFYATGTVNGSPRSEVVAFDARLHEHHVADLPHVTQATSPLALSRKGDLMGTLDVTQGKVAGLAFKVTGF